MTSEELEEYETEPVDDDLRDLLKRLLIKDPLKRITLKEVKHHPWVLDGIADPIAWVEHTDPERSSQGAKIEITTEDVETAVSYNNSMLGRAKSAIKKAGTWYRGLRKRGSSRTKDLKERGSTSTLDTEGAERRGAYSNYHESDEWDSADFKEDERWNSLVPTDTNSSTGSSDTVLGRPAPRSDARDYMTAQPPLGTNFAPSVSERRLRRKQSQRFLTSATLRRHTTTTTAGDASGIVRETHLGPTHAPPSSPQPDDAVCTVRAECGGGSAFQSPTVVQHMVRSARSRDLLRDSRISNGKRHSESPSRARAILSEALHSVYSNGHSRRHGSGASDDSEHGPGSYSSASSESDMRHRIGGRAQDNAGRWGMGYNENYQATQPEDQHSYAKHHSRGTVSLDHTTNTYG
jgi:[calcium/calmodulin-dependent protein kinase] kinase